VDNTPLTDAELLLNLENLVGAAENAGLSIATGLTALLQFPAEWRRVQEDRTLIAPAAEEIFRWASSATHSMRTAVRACSIAGCEVTAGSRVLLWLPSANRDGAAFTDPDCFDVGRRPNRHVAFGVGEHACIGSSLARVQLRVLLAEILNSVSTIEQIGPATPLRSIAVNGPARLPVRLVPK
jgi:cytochrome P450